MRSIVFEGDTWERYEDLRRRDPGLHRVLCRQLKEMQRGDPAVGTGKPEPLKHGLGGLWSRRLALKDRLIYRFDDISLYVIAIGGNDIRDALAAEQPSAVIGAALARLGDNVVRLYQAGARKFLLWNVPNLGRTPAILRLDAVVCGPAGIPGCIVNGARAASEGYNAGFNGVLLGLGALPEIEIVPFDTFASLEAIAGNPAKFGLVDASSACIQPNVPQFGFPSASPFRCAQPDRFFFWDGIHPTRAGHAIIAFLVGKALLTEALQND